MYALDGVNGNNARKLKVRRDNQRNGAKRGWRSGAAGSWRRKNNDTEAKAYCRAASLYGVRGIISSHQLIMALSVTPVGAETCLVNNVRNWADWARRYQTRRRSAPSV